MTDKPLPFLVIDLDDNCHVCYTTPVLEAAQQQAQNGLHLYMPAEIYQKSKEEDERRYDLYMDAQTDKDYALSLLVDAEKRLKQTPQLDPEALRDVLRALTGPPHLIRELLVTRGCPGASRNPLDIIFDQYNDWAEAKAKG